MKIIVCLLLSNSRLIYFISLSMIYQDTPLFVLYTDLHSGFDSTPKTKVLMIRFCN